MAVELSRITQSLMEYYSDDVINIDIKSEFESNFANIKIIEAEFCNLGFRSFYLKLNKYEPEMFETIKLISISEFDSSQRALDIVSDNYPSSTIIMIDIYTEDCAVLSEAIEGVRFDTLLSQSTTILSRKSKFQQLCRLNFRAGEWLKYFHQSTMSCDDILNFEEVSCYLYERLNLLGNYQYFSVNALDCESILKKVSFLFDQVPHESLRKCWVHGDFAPFNMIADSGRVVVFDFGAEVRNSPLFDLAYYCNFLDEHGKKFYISTSKTNFAKQEFLRGYNFTEIIDHNLFRIFMVMMTLCKLVSFFNKVESNASIVKKKLYKNMIRKYIIKLNTFLGN